MTSGEEEVNLTADDKSKAVQKTVRRRKKHLYSAIRTQMEFYFGDANLSKDRFLSKCISENEDGYVSLDVFLSFNKIRKMTTELKTLKKSLKHSTLLQLNEDGTSVRRTTEVVRRSDVDDCTIYVERFPPNIDHEWLKQVFSQFGAITYVSLPKFPNELLKGFAFVEFEKPESAQKAFRYYYPSCHPQPLETDEISTRAPVQKGTAKDNKDNSKKLKRKLDETESGKEPENSTDENRDNCEESQQKKRTKNLDTSFDAKNKSKEQEVLSADSANEAASANVPVKKKKPRKKRKKIPAMKELPYIYPLRIMLKNDWKKEKKRYLAIQKANMTKLKSSLLTYHQQTRTSIAVVNENIEEKKALKQKYEFVPGAIVFFNIPKNCQDHDSYKKLKSNPGVQYIDVDESASKVFIRCIDSASASEMTKTLENEEAEVLSGQPEEDYWKKLWCDQEARLNTKNKTKKQKRGVEKVLAKAERVIQQRSKHIRFDE